MALIIRLRLPLEEDHLLKYENPILLKIDPWRLVLLMIWIRFMLWHRLRRNERLATLRPMEDGRHPRNPRIPWHPHHNHKYHKQHHLVMVDSPLKHR